MQLLIGQSCVNIRKSKCVSCDFFEVVDSLCKVDSETSWAFFVVSLKRVIFESFGIFDKTSEARSNVAIKVTKIQIRSGKGSDMT